ncbi:MAG TPA: class I adenylate-forming enzyme family protein [Tepidisphaeraceae bacterium]
MELLERLDRHAASAGGQVAYGEVGGAGRQLSYAELAGLSRGMAAHLHAGDVVMVCLPNRIEYPVAFLGALRAGCAVFPVSADTTDAELVTLARQANASAIIGTQRACAALAGVVSVAITPEEVLSHPDHAVESAGGDLLLCSSGTTGRPKIVVRDARSLDAVSANMVKGVGFGPDDRVLAVVPLCHSYGLEHGLLAPVWAGSGVRLCAGLDMNGVMAELTGGGVTMFPAVPSVYEMMCQQGGDRRPTSLRKTYAAGAPLPASVYEAFEAKFGVRIGQLYGATEVGSVAFADPDSAHFDARSVGRAFDGVVLKVVDPTNRQEVPTGSEGEVLIAAPSMFRGYLNQAEPATSDGFFATGDLGRVDEFGNLRITGRLKLLVDVGGLKVNVLEVEELLSRHPSVAEAAVIGMPVTQTVSRLKAVVTARDPARPPVVEELRHFLRERLTGYKVPRVIEVVPSLPRSASGKVLRRLLETP